MGNNVSTNNKHQRQVQKPKKRFGMGAKKAPVPVARPPPPSSTPRFALPSQKRAIAEAEAAEAAKSHKLNFKNKVRRATSDPSNVKTRHKSRVAPTKKKSRKHKKHEPLPPKKESLLDKLNPNHHQEPVPAKRKTSLIDKLNPNHHEPVTPTPKKKTSLFKSKQPRQQHVPKAKSRGFKLGKKKNPPPPPPKQSAGKKLMKRFRTAKKQPRY